MTTKRSGISIEDINEAFRIVDGEAPPPSSGELLRLTLVAEYMPCKKKTFYRGNGATCSRVVHVDVPSNASSPERAKAIFKAQDQVGKMARLCPACSVSQPS